MPNKKTARMPRFKSEAEEAAWWDRHPDFVADLFDKAAKEGKIMHGLPKSRSVTIRIATPDLQAARKLAERKGLPYQTYIKTLLHQALQRERAAG